MSNKSTKCPNCGVEVDVNELLYHQLEEQAKQSAQKLIAEQNAKMAEQHEEIENREQNLLETVNQQVTQSLEKKEKILRAKIEQDQAQQLKAMQIELEEKSKKVAELNKAHSEIERLKREKLELRSEIELDVEKKLSAQLSEKSLKIQQQLEEKNAFRVAEKEQIIDQLKQQLSDAQLKAEQGSTQLHGEVQELAIEQWLSQQFPLDNIEEIKKGASGADALQTINTQSRSNCGKIYYESKRTKAFQPSWIAKFKSDIQEKSADIGVLVTQTMPDAMDSLGQIDGVWVCTFQEFKNLAQVLRQSLIQLDQSLVIQENKGDKMGMLYDYLTGTEFRMQIEAIVEGFTQLKIDLESEKRSMQGIWKKREKQIDRVLLNTNFMYSSVKGIAGNAVQDVPLLELSQNDDSD